MKSLAFFFTGLIIGGTIPHNALKHQINKIEKNQESLIGAIDHITKKIIDHEIRLVQVERKVKRGSN